MFFNSVQYDNENGGYVEVKCKGYISEWCSLEPQIKLE